MDADRLGHRIQLTQVAQQEESGLRVAAEEFVGLVPKSVPAAATVWEWCGSERSLARRAAVSRMRAAWVSHCRARVRQG